MMNRLNNVNGATIVKQTAHAGTWYAARVSADVARITVNNVPGVDRYAVNVTYINPLTGRPFNRSHHVYLVDFLEYYLNDVEHYNDEDMYKLITDFMKDFLQNHVFCTGHTGKMHGITSCSTCAACNARCKARYEGGAENCICTKCFAFSQMEYQKSTRLKYARNTEVLTKIRLNWEWVPEEVSNNIFRFESFGDLNNPLQFENYCSIAASRPAVMHTLWTKNPDIIEKAIETGTGIPANMIIIYSSPIINDVRANMLERYWFINKIFTVWTSEEAAKKAGCKINCGARDCNICRRCYRFESETFIHELLK